MMGTLVASRRPTSRGAESAGRIACQASTSPSASHHDARGARPLQRHEGTHGRWHRLAQGRAPRHLPGRAGDRLSRHPTRVVQFTRRMESLPLSRREVLAGTFASRSGCSSSPTLSSSTTSGWRRPQRDLEHPSRPRTARPPERAQLHRPRLTPRLRRVDHSLGPRGHPSSWLLNSSELGRIS